MTTNLPSLVAAEGAVRTIGQPVPGLHIPVLGQRVAASAGHHPVA